MLLLPRLSQVNGNRSVDIHSIHTFFFLSGVELPYLLQRESQRLSNFFNWPVHFFGQRGAYFEVCNYLRHYDTDFSFSWLC